MSDPLPDPRFPDWPEAERRSDGLVVQHLVGDAWIILPPDDRLAVSLCPCCNRGLPTQLEARWVADAMYPVGTKL